MNSSTRSIVFHVAFVRNEWPVDDHLELYVVGLPLQMFFTAKPTHFSNLDDIWSIFYLLIYYLFLLLSSWMPLKSNGKTAHFPNRVQRLVFLFGTRPHRHVSRVTWDCRNKLKELCRKDKLIVCQIHTTVAVSHSSQSYFLANQSHNMCDVAKQWSLFYLLVDVPLHVPTSHPFRIWFHEITFAHQFFFRVCLKGSADLHGMKYMQKIAIKTAAAKPPL